MNTLLSIHSYLRYLVLLVGVVAVAYYAFGLATKRPVDKLVRILGSSFAGLLDTQILLGIIGVALGRYYPALIGHIVMMVLAAGLAHALLVVNRKRPNPGYLLPLIGVGGALVLMAGGIFAIGRGLLSGVYL
jgi:vacuolar-type H+-ATPase subunit I/STV1